MNQKELFKDQNEIDLESIDINEGVDLSLIDDRLVPEMFYIFPTGGYHLFNKCEKEIPEIYRQKIWPFVLRVKPSLYGCKTGKYSERYIMNGSVHGSFYISITLPHKNIKTNNKVYHANGRYEYQRAAKIFNNLHRLVAQAFIPNPDNKKIVDHINGNRVDYRVENLRWCTLEENSMGCGSKRTMDEIFDKVKSQPWFNGKSSNQLNVHKNNFFRVKEEDEKRQQIAFTFNTNF